MLSENQAFIFHFYTTIKLFTIQRTTSPNIKTAARKPAAVLQYNIAATAVEWFDARCPQKIASLC